MSQSIRIAVLINSLGGGGAERVASLLAPELARRQQPKGWLVSFVTLDSCEECYRLPDGFEVVRLKADGSYWDSFRRLRSHLRTGRYDAVLSFLPRANCLNVLLKGMSGHAAVISERGDPNRLLGSGVGGWMKRLLVRLLYPRADSVVVVAQALGRRLQSEYGVPVERLSTIYNPVYTEQRSVPAAGTARPDLRGRPFVVAVGRLVPEKGFDLLIEAFSRSRYGGSLVILGEGPERAALEAMAARFDIAERVRLPGFVADPAVYLEQADAFVLSSRAEGFPNALVEAMSVGCPVLAANCEFGPAEILQGVERLELSGLYEASGGLLVPPEDVDQLAAGIDAVTRSERREFWSERARRRAAGFTLAAAAAQYAEVLEKSIAEGLAQPGGRCA